MKEIKYAKYVRSYRFNCWLDDWGGGIGILLTMPFGISLLICGEIENLIIRLIFGTLALLFAFCIFFPLTRHGFSEYYPTFKDYLKEKNIKKNNKRIKKERKWVI